jgi:hypothetical protein
MFRKLDLFPSLRETVGQRLLTDLCPTEGDGPVIESSLVGSELTEQVHPGTCSGENDPVSKIMHLTDII